MPNRIVREGFLDSELIDSLGAEAECWYHRLLLMCDDAGRFDGRPIVLASRAYPLKDTIKGADVEKILDQLEETGLIIRYECRGKPYLQLTRWQKCGKALKSKFPWRNGNFSIKYVEIDTRDGEKSFVVTSIPDPMPTPSDGVQSKKVESHTETETDFENGDGGGDDARERRDAAGAAEVDMEEIDKAAGPHRPQPIPYREIVDAFNEILGNRYLKPVMYATGTRKDEIARLWNFLEEEMDHILAYWLRVSRSKFLTGRLPGKSFKASFDWLLSVDNAAKVLEGQYDNEGR